MAQEKVVAGEEVSRAALVALRTRLELRYRRDLAAVNHLMRLMEAEDGVPEGLEVSGVTNLDRIISALEKAGTVGMTVNDISRATGVSPGGVRAVVYGNDVFERLPLPHRAHGVKWRLAESEQPALI